MMQIEVNTVGGPLAGGGEWTVAEGSRLLLDLE